MTEEEEVRVIVARQRRARDSRIEKRAVELDKQCRDIFGASDVALAIDALITARLDTSPAYDSEHEEEIEAALRNLRRLLARAGV